MKDKSCFEEDLKGGSLILMHLCHEVPLLIATHLFKVVQILIQNFLFKGFTSMILS